jgi:hypothetical protein
MTMTNSDYAVGRGKPPVHTRFRKGQSGNPSGKPGPAKLLKARFQRALYNALEMPATDVALSPPDCALVEMAKQLTLDAMAGRTAAQRLLLKLLDDQIAESAKSAPLANAPEDEAEDALGLETVEPLPERNETQPSSLVQGKRQGKFCTAARLEPACPSEQETSIPGPRASGPPVRRANNRPFPLLRGRRARRPRSRQNQFPWCREKCTEAQRRWSGRRR